LKHESVTYPVPVDLAVVIQVRVASSRLPFKALLPVAEMPSILLCALRAANDGLPVIVATSDTAPDDAIAAVLDAAKVAVFRGPQHDVLRRFVLATAHLGDDGIVVRLTADNLFPDGSFVRGLLSAFLQGGSGYLATSSPADGLPYGMSAEVFTVKALRRADREASSAFDREHVTPWLRRQVGIGGLTLADPPKYWARLRCTIDTPDDYLVVSGVFSEVADAVQTPWRELVERLADRSRGGRSSRCPFKVSGDNRTHSRLTLGAVQMGVAYGIANQAGLPSEHEVAELLARAADAGVTAIDTARAYGDSESRIGRLLPANCRDRMTVITKLDVLSGIPADAPRNLVSAAVDASVFRSLHELRARRLDALLLHRWNQRKRWGGAVWQRLLELQRDGLIGVLGASVVSAAEAIEALGDSDVGQLQCPVNILDHRFRTQAFLQAVVRRPEVVIHARSVLLQGLLTLPPSRWPRLPNVDAYRICREVDSWQRDFGRTDRVDLCIAYVTSLPWVTSLVVGCETVGQLLTNLSLIGREPLGSAQRAQIDDYPALPESLLDPAQWIAVQ
jgi:spore coat polysaccharide biosynthesis protein SpsF (cytidylyltransferase family)/aryl-alcohol dehydrogenase-like predicted oxidoreductase